MWQYAWTIPASLFIALFAVWFSHWLSRINEYRKAISSVRGEIDVNIATYDLICKEIDDDLTLREEHKMVSWPYHSFHDLAWSTYRGVILLRNPEVAVKIDKAYSHIPIANKSLDRMKEIKSMVEEAIYVQGSIPKIDIDELWKKTLSDAKRYISEELLPRLKEAKELLDKESEGWLRRLF